METVIIVFSLIASFATAWAIQKATLEALLRTLDKKRAQSLIEA